jgi:two-component system CheB/CheR fusion protein
LRVLVVEDDAQLADLLALNITMNGHEVAVARDAASAIAITEAFRPAVVLLDIGLPGMNGYDVADRIRNVPGMADIRVVAVTGYALPTDRRRSRVAGFDRHLVKPVNLDDLERILEAWAEEAAQTDA